MEPRNSAKSWAGTTFARAALDAAFKKCCLRTGRYDGALRNHFFPRIIASSLTAGRRTWVIFPRRNDCAFFRAFRARDVAVQFDDVPAPGALVKSIHVLRDEMEPLKEPLHFCQSEVGGVWICIGDELPPPLIPFPNEAGIASEGARSGQFLGSEFCPQAGLGISKCGNTAFGGYAGARQHGHAFGGGEALEQFSRNCHGWILTSL
jgi:hypothetical protein